MESIIGESFRKGKDTVSLDSVMQAKDFIAVYFGAHWAPPCRLFTPQLAEFYKKINSDAFRMEVIFCSIDGSPEAFERNFADMPWSAVPYSEDQRIQNLKQKFGINGLPTLIVLDKRGDIVSYDGRLDIQNHQEGAFEIWQKKAASMIQ